MKTGTSTVFAVAIAAAVTISMSVQSWAAKEKFVRSKPHVNIGTIAASDVELTLVSEDGSQTTTTGDNGEFWFEGLQPGYKKLYVGNLSYGDHPPDPGRITIEGAYVAEEGNPSGPKASKPKEIVVVGSRLPLPDTRNFEQLETETKARIPAHNPEWTDYNEGDPGRALLGYQLLRDQDGNTTIIFGDGIRGRRLPTGNDTSSATYDDGAGAAGDDKHDKWIELDSLQENSDARSVSIPIPPSASGDSFFDIIIDINTSSFKGSIVIVGEDEDEQEIPDKPDIPNRPERIDLPDLPTRPTN